MTSGDRHHRAERAARAILARRNARHSSWNHSRSGRSSCARFTLAAAVAASLVTSACKKTGEGEYEVEKPIVGTDTDTVNTPSVETGTVKDTHQRARRRDHREEGSDRAQGGGEDARGAGQASKRAAVAALRSRRVYSAPGASGAPVIVVFPHTHAGAGMPRAGRRLGLASRGARRAARAGGRARRSPPSSPSGPAGWWTSSGARSGGTSSS